MQRAGATGVFQGQSQGGDQQQADHQTGGEHQFRQWGGQLFHKMLGRFQAQGEIAVIEQMQGDFLLQRRDGLAGFAPVDRRAVFQQGSTEVAVVEVAEQCVHQALDAKHALHETVEDTFALLVGDIQRGIENKAATALYQGEAIGKARFASGFGLHGQLIVGVARGQPELLRGFVALHGFDPAHCQIGAQPLNGLIAFEVFQRELTVERPFVPRNTPAVVP